MKRKFAILYAAAFVSIFGAAACGGAGEDIQERAEEQVQEVQQQAEEQVQKASEQIEQEAQEAQERVKEEVGEEQ